MIAPAGCNVAPSSAEERLVPARVLNEGVYCPRLFYLEHAKASPMPFVPARP
jgi:hypothetical protein